MKEKLTRKEWVNSWSRESFMELYKDNSVVGLARKLGVPRKWIFMTLDKLGIQHKTRSEVQQISEVRDLYKDTCLDKYGVTNVFKRSDVRERCSSPEVRARAVESTKKTCLLKYGVDSTNKVPEVQRKLAESIRRSYEIDGDNLLERKRKTSLERYGFSNYAKTPEYHERAHETKTKNKSFSTSKPEEDYYKYLLTIYDKDDIFRQYKDERYPYHCDFYIKSVDLFIELNLYWSHGGHPFDPTNKDDLNRLEEYKLKSRDHPSYKDVIKVWTIRDPEKMSCAKEHNLNYKVIYNINEIKETL